MEDISVLKGAYSILIESAEQFDEEADAAAQDGDKRKENCYRALSVSQKIVADRHHKVLSVVVANYTPSKIRLYADGNPLLENEDPYLGKYKVQESYKHLPKVIQTVIRLAKQVEIENKTFFDMINAGEPDHDFNDLRICNVCGHLAIDGENEKSCLSCGSSENRLIPLQGYGPSAF